MTLHARVLGVLAGHLLLLALAWIPAVSCAQNANDGFDPNANGGVVALAVQPDGKLVVGGGFTSLSPNGGGAIPRNYIARLTADGSVDATYDPNANSSANALVVQPDGKLLVGGAFTSLSPNGGGTSTRNHIARLNVDGSVDTAFDPNANNVVYALAVQPDGKLVLGGNFTSLSPNGGGTVTRNYIARLNVDGSLDTTFDPRANGIVYALAVQPDGKLLVGGEFTSFSPNGGGAITRNKIARLNADGSVDTAFDPNANSTVNALVLQPDGKLVVGGFFNSLSPNGGGASTRNRIARLNVDGSVDAAFDPNASSYVTALAVQANGKLLVGGAFTSFSPNGGGAITRNHIARLNTDGSLDMAFDPSANTSSYVYALAVQLDGKPVMGGDFTSLSPNGGGAITRNRLARLNGDGSVDTALNPNADGSVYGLALQPDGKLVVSGFFSSLSPNGGAAVIRDRIARLNSDGSLDAAFNPNPNGAILAIAPQPDGKLMVRGSFTSFSPNGGGGVARNRVARLNVDGSVDAFNPNPNDIVYAMALQPDGKLVLGGAFASFGGGAVARPYLARLNVDGSVDTAFNPRPNAEVYALAVQSDGKLLVGGNFATFSPNGGGAITRNHLARLNANGTVDTAFDPNVDDYVEALALQPDGKVVLAGVFTSLSPNGGSAIARQYIARLNADGSVDPAFDPKPNSLLYALALQPDGKLALGGLFNFLAPNGGGNISRNHIARLNADGSVDAAFNPNANNTVYSIAVQPDGKLLAAGDFATIGGQTRNRIARLSTPQTALQSLSIVSYTGGGSSITWTRAEAGPELALPPQLLFSLTDSTYTPVGTMQRISSGWRYSGFVPPLNQNFYLRTRGQVSSGAYNAGGLIESTRQVYLSVNDGIFANGFE